MPIMDMNDPQVRAEAIASGYIWSCPMDAQEKACDDIAAGKVPVPTYLPTQARTMLAERGMQVEGGASSAETGMPA